MQFANRTKAEDCAGIFRFYDKVIYFLECKNICRALLLFDNCLRLPLIYNY